jgi:hypothetical protein
VKPLPQLWVIFLLVGSPTLVLCDLTALYALVPTACASGGNGDLQILNACSFLLVLGAFAFSHVQWRRQHGLRGLDYYKEDDQSAFLAFLSMAVAVLCALSLLALWIPQWVLDPCAG